MVNGQNPKKRGETFAPDRKTSVRRNPQAGDKPKHRRLPFAPHPVVHLRRYLRLPAERKNLEYPRLSEAAERAGVDKKTIERWLAESAIPYFRLNGIRRVHWDSLQASLEDRARRGANE